MWDRESRVQLTLGCPDFLSNDDDVEEEEEDVEEG